jgi:hypothetical protein
MKLEEGGEGAEREGKAAVLVSSSLLLQALLHVLSHGRRRSMWAAPGRRCTGWLFQIQIYNNGWYYFLRLRFVVFFFELHGVRVPPDARISIHALGTLHLDIELTRALRSSGTSISRFMIWLIGAPLRHPFHFGKWSFLLSLSRSLSG